MANEKAMQLLQGIVQAAGEKQRDEAIREAGEWLDEIVIRDDPGTVQFIGFATEKPEPAPEQEPTRPWWSRWFRRPS